MFRTSDMVVIGVLSAVAYWLYKKVSGPGSVIDNTENTIASFFPGTSPTVVPQGSVQLPNGQVVPVASMVNLGFQADGTLQMSYAGSTYIISSAGGGAYTAQLAGLGSVDRYRCGLWR